MTSLRAVGDLAGRVVVLVLVATAAVLVGSQIRGVRETSGQAASAPTASAVASRPPSAAPTAKLTAGPPVRVTPQAAIPTSNPTPLPTMPPKTSATPPPSLAPVAVFTVTGRVAAGTTPVTHAELRVYPADAQARGPTPVPPETAKARTDARGVFALKVPTGAYRIGAYLDTGAPERAAGYHWVTWYGDALAIGLGKDLVVSKDTSGADISMLRAVVVSGRVVGRDGIGVPAAQVRLVHEAPGPWPGGPFSWELGSAITDATGAFSTRVVPMTAKVQATAAGTTTAVWTVVDVDLNGDAGGMILTLDRGHIVSGVLRGATGAALSDIGFVVVADPTGAICSYSCTGRTDGSGRFAVTVPTGVFRFVLQATTPSSPTLTSKSIGISADTSVDPVVAAR